jgi:hypothetical protein
VHFFIFCTWSQNDVNRKAVVVQLVSLRLRVCLCSIFLTVTRFDSTGLDWGCVKIPSSCKDVRDVEIEVHSEPRLKIHVQINGSITKYYSWIWLIDTTQDVKFLKPRELAHKYQTETTNYLIRNMPTTAYTRHRPRDSFVTEVQETNDLNSLRTSVIRTGTGVTGNFALSGTVQTCLHLYVNYIGYEFLIPVSIRRAINYQTTRQHIVERPSQ